MGVDQVRTVHRAGAAAHHQAVEALQEGPEADLMQETVLRGDMPAAKHDPVGPLHEVRGDAGVAPVQHDDGGGGDSGIADAFRHRVQHIIRELAVVRGRADQQHARLRGQGLLHRGKQSVVGGDVVLPVTGRTSRENQRHRGCKDNTFRRLCHAGAVSSCPAGDQEALGGGVAVESMLQERSLSELCLLEGLCTFGVVKTLVPILIILSLLSCTDRRDVGSLILDRAESLMNERPDSALALIESIDTIRLRGRSAKARWSLLHTMSLDKSYQDISDTSLLASAVAYYEHHGPEEKKMLAYFYRGRGYYFAHRLEKAALFFSLAEDAARSSRDDQFKGLLYMSMSDLYDYRFRQKEELIRKAIAHFAAAGDSTHYHMGLGSLAMSLTVDRWQEADSLFNLSLSRIAHDTVFCPTVQAAYAKLKVLQPEPDPSGAVRQIKEILQDGGELSVQDYGVYAFASEMMGNKTEADRVLLFLDTVENQSETYYWRYRIAAWRKDMPQANEYLKATYNWQDDALAEFLEQSVPTAVEAYHERLAEEEKSKNKALVIRVAAAAILLGALALFGILSMRRRAVRLKEKNLDLERRLLALRESYASLYKQKYAVIKKLDQEYRDARGTPDYSKRMLSKMEKEISILRQSNRKNSRLVRQVNRDLDGVLTRMQQELAPLSNEDVLFICYSIIGLSASQVSELTGLTEDYVYTKRSLLRARIQSCGSPDREEFARVL